MIGRQINPLINLYDSGQYDLVDAFLSLPISGFLLLGVLGLKGLLLRAENNESTLALLTQLDPLTNSFSRSEVLYRISEEIDRSRRNQHVFALMEMDIDHFKKVNDQFGHQVGDEILVSLVRHAKDVLRSIDTVGRIGGEEFLILLPETSLEEALRLAERLRMHIAKATHHTSTPSPVQITISIGITIFNPSKKLITERGILLNELIKEADEAMYEAKNSGRNRVTVWSPKSGKT